MGGGGAAPSVSSFTPVASAPAILPAASVASAPATIGASSVLPAGVLPGPLSQVFRGKREADAEADAEADPQLLINGAFGSPVVTVAGAPVATIPDPVAPVAASTVVRTPVCRAVTNKKCQKVPQTVQRTIVVPKCTTVPRCADVPHCVAVPVPRC